MGAFTPWFGIFMWAWLAILKLRTFSHRSLFSLESAWWVIWIVFALVYILLTINPRSMTLLAASSQQTRRNQLIYWVLGHWYSTFCNMIPSGYFGKWKMHRHGSMSHLLLFHKVCVCFFTTTSSACAKTVWTIGFIRHRGTALLSSGFRPADFSMS